MYSILSLYLNQQNYGKEGAKLEQEKIYDNRWNGRDSGKEKNSWGEQKVYQPKKDKEQDWKNKERSEKHESRHEQHYEQRERKYEPRQERYEPRYEPKHEPKHERHEQRYEPKQESKYEKKYEQRQDNYNKDYQKDNYRDRKYDNYTQEKAIFVPKQKASQENHKPEKGFKKKKEEKFVNDFSHLDPIDVSFLFYIFLSF
jgi:hypothetical protein